MRRIAGMLAAVLLSLSACTVPPTLTTEPPVSEPVAETAAVPPRVSEPAPPPFALPYYPDGGLDPLTVQAATNAALLPLLYDSLFELDADFSPLPRLCLRAERDESGMVWTLFLRAGVTFSDGTPLTPDAVRTCLNALRAGDSIYRARLSDVAGIQAGEGKIVVTLHTPNAALPALLDIPIFLPGTPQVGTGPYVLRGDRLTRRADWWRGADGLLAEILLCEVASVGDVVSAFDSGAIAAVNVNLTGTDAPGYAGNYEPWEYPTTNLLYLGFQTAKGPCADRTLRHALLSALDRETIAEVLFAGHATAAPLPVHPAVYSNAGLETAVRYDPTRAAEQLEDGGWRATDSGRMKGREALSLTLIVSSENAFRVAAAERLAEDFAALGVEVQVDALGWTEYRAALADGAFDLYLAECRMTADFDLTALIAKGGPLNYGGYVSEETRLLHTAYREAGRTAAAPLYEALVAEAPIAPLCFTSGTLLTRWGRVAGASPAPGNVFFAFEAWTVD